MQGRGLSCWWSRLRRFEELGLHSTKYQLYGATDSKESICRLTAPTIQGYQRTFR